MIARYLKLMTAHAVFVFPVLTGCHSAPTRIFTLDAVAPTSTGAYKGPPLRVDVIHIPPALDRIEIVRNVAPGELKISDVDHWSAPLGQIARQTLSADLIQRLPPGQIIFPNLPKPDGALGVRVDLLDFKGDAQGASLQASWVFNSSDPKSGPAGGTAVFHTSMHGSDAAATAQAWSALLAQLADRIAADL